MHETTMIDITPMHVHQQILFSPIIKFKQIQKNKLLQDPTISARQLSIPIDQKQIAIHSLVHHLCNLHKIPPTKQIIFKIYKKKPSFFYKKKFTNKKNRFWFENDFSI